MFYLEFVKSDLTVLGNEKSDGYGVLDKLVIGKKN